MALDFAIITQPLELEAHDMFRKGYVLNFPADGEQAIYRIPLNTEGVETDAYHVVMPEQELDYIAWLYYRKYVENAEKYWWVIADANNIFNPLDTASLEGTTLLIPNLPKILLSL